MSKRAWTTPRDQNLGLLHAKNACGLHVSRLPNGALFALELETGARRFMINQLLGSPVAGGLAGIVLRVEGEAPVEATGAGAARFGGGERGFVWEGEAHGVSFRASLALAAAAAAWVWEVEVENRGGAPRALDAVLIQDVGLGPRGFLMSNEAYASQYVDHFIAAHPAFGPVVTCRQNLPQDGAHPFVMHGCFDGATGFSTDGREIFGPRARGGARSGGRGGGRFASPFGELPPSLRLQHEMACVALYAPARRLAPGESARWRWFGLAGADQPGASSEAGLSRIDAVDWPPPPAVAALAAPRRSLVETAPVLAAEPPCADDVARAYPGRFEVEAGAGDAPASFFAPDGPLNRHVVSQGKELDVTRRHGAILRTGAALLPDDATLCATAWAHGVFAAQLTIGNTSFHKIFTVSRDPYNATRGSGLRMMALIDGRWRLLAVPTLFEMGLSDCRWIYVFAGGRIVVSAEAAGEDPAMIFRVEAEGAPLRFLVFGQLALGEREYEHAGRIEADAEARRFTLRPDPDFLWGAAYPQAACHIVSATPGEIEAIGGEELLHDDPHVFGGGHVALRTRATNGFSFAVTGSMRSAREAERLADKYARGASREQALEPARSFWRTLARGARVEGDDALDAVLPWLVQNALIHLSVPRGLEQYTGAAWGVRDVCQGPVELLLALRHDAPVKEILRVVFAQQYEDTADWPQWFMLAPYGAVQGRVSHGDVIVWPLKAVCDYLEATGDFAFLDEEMFWRDRESLELSPRKDTLGAHLERLMAAVEARFIPGTRLIAYGEGDWNDSLQPADPSLRERMTSAWTVALLFQQLERYAAALDAAGRSAEAARPRALAAGVRDDFRALLIRDGVVAGYGLFDADEAAAPELLLHPSDRRTGLSYSLLAIERAIAAGLLDPGEADAHMTVISEHLLYPDGARLLDRPVAYRGGPEKIFRRAESASFFGREIGLMYTHEHLRYAELLARRGETERFFEALAAVNPVCAAARVPAAAPRQRNAFFSSSDAAFRDRASASADWEALRAGKIALEGGWRVYSSGPGIFLHALVAHGFGRVRRFGVETAAPRTGAARLIWDLDAQA
ncbi:cellobiose phosphorylase [Methylocella sp.]|uniref:cellobiose phosphorylase n=1 Tax=Methylocella sp. TaxID=1978226 RepID=UPI003784A90F